MSMAAIIRELIAAGVTGDALVAAVERIEEAAKPERSSAAIRQQRYRDRQAARVTRDVTDVTTVTPTPLPPFPPKENIKPPLTPIPPDGNAAGAACDFALVDAPVTAKAKPKQPAHRLPVDWEPQPLAADTLARWDGDDLNRELERFRDHWAASGGATARKLDWQAAWRNWIRNAEDRKPKDHRNGNPTRPLDFSTDYPSPRRSVGLEMLRDLANGDDGGFGADEGAPGLHHGAILALPMRS